MSRTVKIVLHLIAPVAVWMALSGMYFSRHVVMQRLVSPKLPPLAINTWREYGLLENLQILVLLSMAGVAIHGAILARERMRTAGLALGAALALFVLLEEVDYGTLWLNYARAAPLEWFEPETRWPPALRSASYRVDAFNLHTAGERFRWMKRGADVFTFMLLVVFPLVVRRFKAATRWASWAPDPWLVATVCVMVVLRFLIHAIAGWDEQALASVTATGGTIWENGSMSSNLSEFGELLLYYCFFLYVVQQVYTGASAPCGRSA